MLPTLSLAAARVRALVQPDKENPYERVSDFAFAQEACALIARRDLAAARAELALLDDWLRICEEARLADLAVLPIEVCVDMATSSTAPHGLREAAIHANCEITPIQDAIFDAEQIVMRRISSILGSLIEEDEGD